MTTSDCVFRAKNHAQWVAWIKTKPLRCWGGLINDQAGLGKNWLNDMYQCNRFLPFKAIRIGYVTGHRSGAQ